MSGCGDSPPYRWTYGLGTIDLTSFVASLFFLLKQLKHHLRAAPSLSLHQWPEFFVSSETICLI